MSDEISLYTVRGAAEALALSARQIYKLIQTGQLPAIRIGDGSTRITRRALETYVNSRPETKDAPVVGRPVFGR